MVNTKLQFKKKLKTVVIKKKPMKLHCRIDKKKIVPSILPERKKMTITVQLCSKTKQRPCETALVTYLAFRLVHIRTRMLFQRLTTDSRFENLYLNGRRNTFCRRLPSGINSTKNCPQFCPSTAQGCLFSLSWLALLCASSASCSPARQ